MIRVVVVDDHEVVVQGLRMLLGEQADVEVVGTANDGAAAARLAQELRPDVVLMDLSMPGTDGIEGTRLICESVPEAAVVVLTTYGDRDRVLASLDAGAVGYLMKDVSPQVLSDGVRAAANGGSPIDPRVARTLVESRQSGSGSQKLTAKQVEVLRLVAEGLPNRLVARRLDISEKTVKAHLTQIYATLGVTDRVQAALWAQEHLT